MEVNKIYNCDCIEGMKQIPDNSIDLCVTSPPYNVGIDYDSYNDKKTPEEYFIFAEKWVKELYRIMKSDGRVCLNVIVTCGTANFMISHYAEYYHIFKKAGFNFFSSAIWDDRTIANKTAWGSWLSASAPYVNSPYEAIMFFYKDQWKKIKKGKTTISKEEFVKATRGIWSFHPQRREGHPAPFPIELPSLCIKLFSWEGDLVLDPFIGSGTTAEACMRLNREYIGFEISKKYCDMIKDKTEQTRTTRFYC